MLLSKNLSRIGKVGAKTQWGLEANEGPELKRARGQEVLKDKKKIQRKMLNNEKSLEINEKTHVK